MKREHCDWCGTKLRGRDTCPRGPVCRREQQNHDALMDRIRKGER